MGPPGTSRWLAVVMAGSTICGCSTLRGYAQERRRAEALRDRANFCAKDGPQALMVRPESIQVVEPLRVFRRHRGPLNEVLLGARLHLRNSASVEPRELEGALRCYEADAASRSDGSAESPDPFWLAEGRVRISVLQADSDWTIELRAEPEFEAPRILENAEAFARRPTDGSGTGDRWRGVGLEKT